MKKTLNYILLLLSINQTAFAQSEYEEVSFELLEVTIPANMDDHGKFGLSSPDFELSLQFNCGGLRDYAWKKSSFTLPANNTNHSITHSLKGKNVVITLTPHELKQCSYGDVVRLSLEEDELLGTDDYADVDIKNTLYSRNSPLKQNSTYDLAFGQNQLGEARWTIFGLGSYDSIIAKVRIQSRVLK